MAARPLTAQTSSRPTVVRLTVRAAYVWVASLMLIIGLALSTAAFAAGVTRIDVLTMLFAMGAAATLFAIVVWYLLQLRPPSS